MAIVTELPIPQLEIQKVYPSTNDISVIKYDGINSSEENFSLNQRSQSPRNYVLPNIDVNGFDETEMGFLITVEDVAAGEVSVTTGRAYINGRVYELLDSYVPADTLQITDGFDSYVYLKAEITAGVAGVAPTLRVIVDPVALDAEPNQQPNAIMLALVRRQGGNITSIVDRRNSQVNIPIPEMRKNIHYIESEAGSGWKYTDWIAAGLAAGGDDYRSWKSLAVPDLDQVAFTVGGYVAIGIGELTGGGVGDITYQLQLSIRGEDGVVIDSTITGLAQDVYADEDHYRAITTEYLEITIDDTNLPKWQIGQQFQIRIGLNLLTADLPSGFGSFPCVILQTSQKYNFDDQNDAGPPPLGVALGMLDGIAEIDEDRLVVNDFVSQETSSTWAIRNTEKFGIIRFP